MYHVMNRATGAKIRTAARVRGGDDGELWLGYRPVAHGEPVPRVESCLCSRETACYG